MCVQYLDTFLADLSGVDLDGADILSPLHSLYSMTFTALGKLKSKADTSNDRLIFKVSKNSLMLK